MQSVQSGFRGPTESCANLRCWGPRVGKLYILSPSRQFQACIAWYQWPHTTWPCFIFATPSRPLLPEPCTPLPLNHLLIFRQILLSVTSAPPELCTPVLSLFGLPILTFSSCLNLSYLFRFSFGGNLLSKAFSDSYMVCHTSCPSVLQWSPAMPLS